MAFVTFKRKYFNTECRVNIVWLWRVIPFMTFKWHFFNTICRVNAVWLLWVPMSIIYSGHWFLSWFSSHISLTLNVEWTQFGYDWYQLAPSTPDTDSFFDFQVNFFLVKHRMQSASFGYDRNPLVLSTPDTWFLSWLSSDILLTLDADWKWFDYEGNPLIYCGELLASLAAV